MNKRINMPDEYLESIRIAKKNIELHNKTIAATLSEINYDIVNQMREAMNTYYNQIYQTKDLTKVLSEMIKFSSREVIDQFYNDFFQLTELENTIRKAREVVTVSLASNKLKHTIAALMAAIDVYNPPNLMIEQAFRVPIAYQNFAKKQYKYAVKNDSISKRATRVTDEAGNFVLYQQISSETGMEILNEVLPEEKEENNSNLIIPSETNIFSMLNQHISYVYRHDREPNISEAISNSIPAKINFYGCSLIKLVYKINQLHQSRYGSFVFKPTVKSIFGASLLPSLVAINDDIFAKVVDHLYFMIYEGSGSAKRLLEIVSDEDLNNLWYLKHLRLNFRHDLEHGDKIDEKLIKGGKAFNYLINKSWPLEVSDWKKAQLNLYKSITNMLQIVISSIE